jgi:hypothetical protein
MLLNLVHSALCGSGIVVGFITLDKLTKGNAMLAIFSSAVLFYCFENVATLMLAALK